MCSSKRGGVVPFCRFLVWGALMVVLAWATSLMLVGCAGMDGVTSGTGAVYEYERRVGPDVTKVRVASNRDVGQAAIHITPEGEFSASAGGLDSQQIDALLREIRETVEAVLESRGVIRDRIP